MLHVSRCKHVRDVRLDRIILYTSVYIRLCKWSVWCGWRNNVCPKQQRFLLSGIQTLNNGITSTQASFSLSPILHASTSTPDLTLTDMRWEQTLAELGRGRARDWRAAPPLPPSTFSFHYSLFLFLISNPAFVHIYSPLLFTRGEHNFAKCAPATLAIIHVQHQLLYELCNSRTLFSTTTMKTIPSRTSLLDPTMQHTHPCFLCPVLMKLNDETRKSSR